MQMIYIWQKKNNRKQKTNPTKNRLNENEFICVSFSLSQVYDKAFGNEKYSFIAITPRFAQIC